MAKSSKYLRGQLLLDGGKLQGSFFHRTVVLVCQHDAEGAFGLVLNRPATAKNSGGGRQCHHHQNSFLQTQV
jgi:putative transcriptional regulator